MIRRSSAIRAVPAAAISSAPEIAARNSATASDRRRWAPRKLILTVCVFWMMKINTTVRPAVPAINAVRIPLIRVWPGLAWGLGSSGGTCPLVGGGGSVLVPSEYEGLVIALLLVGAGATQPCSLAHPDSSRSLTASSGRLRSAYTGKLKLAI